MFLQFLAISVLMGVNSRSITPIRDCETQVDRAFFSETDFNVTTIECTNRMTLGCYKSDLSHVRMKFDSTTNKTNVDIVILKDIIINTDQNGPFTFLDVNCFGMIRRQVSVKKFCGIEILPTEGRVRLESNGANVAIYSINGIKPVTIMFTNAYEFDLGKAKGSINVVCGSSKLNDYYVIDREYLCKEYYSSYHYLPELFYKPMCKYPILFLTLLILVICTVCIYLISSTPIGYLVYIIFYPVLKLYFYLVDKYMPKCKSCRLVIHPFTRCGSVCKCGELFGNTQRLKAHNSGSVDCTRKIMIVYKTNISLKTVQIMMTLWLLVIVISYIPISLAHMSQDVEVIKSDVKYVTIQDDKAISASVELDFKAIRNNKLLIQPVIKGEELAQIIIEVKDAYYTNTYNLQYTTGPILETHYVWSYSCEEKGCSNEAYKDLGNMTRNRNATTFCYEFNQGSSGKGIEQCNWICFNRGHAYGICNTMIDFKWRTYKKETNLDKSVVLLDVQSDGTGVTYYLESDKGTYEFDKGTIDIKSQDVNVLDQKIVVDDAFQIFYENFNEIGQTSNGCGKIQALPDGEVIGKKINDVQKTCTFLSAPKLKVNRCLDDTQNVCGLGPKYDLMQHTINYRDLGKITLNKTAYIGDAKLVLKLGDVLIKNNQGAKVLAAEIDCEGCYDCVVGSDCTLTYETTDEMYCDLNSNVTKDISRVYLKTGKDLLKFKIWVNFKDKIVNFKVCNIEINISPNLSEGETIYQLLHKNDNKVSVGEDVSHCNTIMCHLKHEFIVIWDALGSAFTFFTTGFISYIFYFVILIALLVLVLACCQRRMRDEYIRYKQL
ncbi:glycoprotein precursor [Kibale virus]|uniref:Envelopment polyprotein n=1 Tax=Kibale virus TaxID=1406344 RepID=U5LV56_9VIRU|nr:glycoprotein precursor [Kibale virus]AGX32063.1 glycoprotein precursor [Kibale virus]